MMTKQFLSAVLAVISLSAVSGLFGACEREPILHLHRGNMEYEMPIIEMELDVIWDYSFVYDIYYDWRAEWYYGEDPELFGGVGEEILGYHKPSVFELRRYFTGNVPYAPHTKKEEFMFEGYTFSHDFAWGYHDLLVWNHVFPAPGEEAVSIIFDEQTTLDSVYAYTNATTRTIKVPNKAGSVRAHYQPEELFSAYDRAEEIDPSLKGFVWDEVRQKYVKSLQATLQPLTYIYLTQIILHHNNGRIVGVDGVADLSGMASSTNVNTGYTGNKPIPVKYDCNMKRHINVEGEDVDIVGGRLLTFGMCNLNCSRVNRGPVSDGEDIDTHYLDCTFIFNNGSERTFSFDVTDQVRTRFRGGVLTVHLDVNDVEIPNQVGGSGFDAEIEEEEEVLHEIEMSPRR